MPLSLLHRRMPRTAAALGAALFLVLGRVVAAPVGQVVMLPGHVPAALAKAHLVGAMSATQTVPLTLTLPLRNQAALTDYLRRIYDKTDPLYGQSLTPAQFTASYGPSQADYDRVVAFAQSQGLTITNTSPGRTILSVSGTAAQVGRAFGVSLNTYQSTVDGRVFYAANANPTIPMSLAGVISGVVGLDNSVVPHPLSHAVHQTNLFAMPVPDNYQLPSPFVANKRNGLTPSDVKSLYNLTSLPQTGSGQTLAVFELDGYDPNDITHYEDTFSLPHVPLTNVRIDGYNGALGGGQAEVTLDIELQIALAPGASSIIVYEAPNSLQAILDLYAKIASDNSANEISSSWGVDERVGSAFLDQENVSFMQMAAQRQSMFAASGDGGAYGGGDNTLVLDDPGSQPYVTGVGGTDINISSSGAYLSESAWGDPTDLGRGPMGTGGGGGISGHWGIPSYQVGVVGSSASLGSTTMRNDPDVSLFGDYDTGGYLIYLQGGYGVYNGTSASSPLWSAYAALVNQQRLVNGLGLLGFANPSLYPIYNDAVTYAADFHDVVGATNLYYPAVTGYDNATGLGSFNGANLLATLSTPPAPPAAPRALKAKNGNGQVFLTWTASANTATYNLYRSTTAGGEGTMPYVSGLTGTSYTDTGLTNGTTYYYTVAAVNSVGVSPQSNEAAGTPALPVTVAIANGGFENGSSRPAPWVASTSVIDNSRSEAAHAGAWKAWLDGYGSSHIDTLGTQIPALPATANSVTLNFSLHVDTAERSKTTAYDTLQLQLKNAAGTVLGTIPVASNINAATGFVSKSIDISAYFGQVTQFVLVGKEDSSFQTSFVVDDFSVTAQ